MGDEIYWSLLCECFKQRVLMVPTYTFKYDVSYQYLLFNTVRWTVTCKNGNERTVECVVELFCFLKLSWKFSTVCSRTHSKKSQIYYILIITITCGAFVIIPFHFKSIFCKRPTQSLLGPPLLEYQAMFIPQTPELQ